MLSQWWARQGPQISTGVGTALAFTAAVAPQMAQQLGAISPRAATYCSMAGAIAGAVLVAWNQAKHHG